MILIKKRISIFFCCLFLFCCSFSATFASELVFNSTFSSGESITIGGEVLTLTLNFKNFDVLIKSETGDAHILEFFGSKLIGNYVFVHGGTILVDTETFKDPYVGSPISPQARRVKLEVYTYEPTLSSNWTISENAVLVGEEVEFVLTLLNTYDAPAEDVSFIHELPASFVLSDIDDCEFSNGVISAVMNLDEDEDHLCTYSGFFTKSFEKTELVSKLSLETLLHNVSFSPDALELTVNDPFKFELDSKTHLNRTEPFDISFKFESTEPSEIIVHDFSVYVPTDFISVEGTTIPLWRGESDLPFGTTYEYESFYKRVSKMTTKGDKLSLNMSLRADVFEYIPLYYSYSYTFDDVMYDSGLKAKYLNISRVGLTDEPVLEYTFSLSDISVDTLKTNSTKMRMCMSKLLIGVTV